MSEEKTVKENLVIAIDYTLTVDDAEVDSSKDREPLEFLQGHGNIISGLEHAMLGMKISEEKKIEVSPADGYGELDETAFMEIPTNQFPKKIPAEVGLELEVNNEKGKPTFARIEEIENNIALLNFKHPLAGKTLIFDVKVIAIRKPSEEELSHGHVHQAGHEH